MSLGRRFVRTDITTTILIPARLMATTDLSFLSTESSSALARGITGVIQLGSGIAAVTGAVVGTGTVGMDTAIGTIIADMPMGEAMHTDTPAPTADSVAAKPSTGARRMAVAASMVEVDSTAADTDKRQFCGSEGEWLAACQPFFCVPYGCFPLFFAVPPASVLARMSHRSTGGSRMVEDLSGG